MRASIKPVITETSMEMARRNWYTFVVPLGENKNTIKRLVEKTFAVEVLAVKTMIVKGKSKRSLKTRRVVKKPDWKKAMVKVKEGQKIAVFETGV
ncbi:MAG TPA: 50S ribosomal protein L23 [Clostridia bacterium]|nr:50S ribosomal protein L23 [Clostridia bacterium]